jgi:hypothetical protein
MTQTRILTTSCTPARPGLPPALMDGIVYTPGAGHPPPVLGGRDTILGSENPRRTLTLDTMRASRAGSPVSAHRPLGEPQP